MKLKHFFRKNPAAKICTLGLSLVFTGCTTTAPVQEMSNARQTLRAAYKVNAQHYAPELFDKAETLLKAAENELSEGEFSQARAYAVSARQEAIRARQKALSQQQN